MENNHSDFFVKIDPYCELIVEIDACDSLSYINRQVGSQHIGFAARTPHGDCAIVDTDALRSDCYPPAWKFRGTEEVYFGTALWVCVSELGELRSPLWSDYFLRESIEFLGFIQPRITIDYEPLEVDEEEMDRDSFDLDDLDSE